MGQESSTQKSRKKVMPKGRPIQKGQVLNPGGRPKIPDDVKKAFRELTPLACETIRSILASRDKKLASARIKAAEVALNRAWGMPRQEIELNGGEPLPVIVIRLPEEVKDDSGKSA